MTQGSAKDTLHDNTASATSPQPAQQIQDVASNRHISGRDPPSSEMHQADIRTFRNERRASKASVDYDIPDSYHNLDDAFAYPPVQSPDEEPIRRRVSREEAAQQDVAGSSSAASPGKRRKSSSATAEAREAHMLQRRASPSGIDYDVPDSYANVAELGEISPIQNPDEAPMYKHHSLEESKSQERAYEREQDRRRRAEEPLAASPELERDAAKVSRLATQIYTISYLILFSILGTLARLGLQALTFYSGAPVVFSSVWPNFAGSLVMGFLSEDRMLFRYEWGTPTYELQLQKAKEKQRDEETNGSGSSSGPLGVDLTAAKKAHMATKKTIPLYIGLATGFCGSFTSFSSFIRDIFLALSNDLLPPDIGATTVPRNGGFSFMALLAVLITTVSLSLSGL